MLQPFTWGGNTGQIKSPATVERERRLAESLMANKGIAQNPWEGLSQITGALSGSVLQNRADEAEAAGQKRAGALFSDLAINSDPNSIIAALTSPDAGWANDAQTSIASALLNQGLERSDPAYQMGLEKARLELDALRNPTPDYPASVEEYLYAQQDPGFAAWQAENGKGQTINVGGESANIGTIPPGYAAVQDPSSPAGYRFERIPGSAAEAEAAAAAATAETAGGRKDLATDIITGAATKARDALTSGGITTGAAGAVAGLLPESQAAEVRRQIDVLKANATIENLTAMRQASPTGGALGSVTEKEGAMLAAASGAIDPNASYDQVLSAIDNYERTLLQVVHGPVVGEQIYQQTRKQDTTAPRTTPSGITFKVLQ